MGMYERDTEAYEKYKKAKSLKTSGAPKKAKEAKRVGMGKYIEADAKTASRMDKSFKKVEKDMSHKKRPSGKMK